MTDAGLAPAAPLRVLVVDDSRAQRQLLAVFLRRMGHEVAQSATAEEALELCAAQPVDLVISDWMMPGMNGVEFCRRFRALPREGYGYFILLTSKSERAEIALGLEAGADDFATKPVSAGELRARLRAGERILSMQAQLVERNRQVAEALAEQRRLYDALDRDLIEARKLQQTLLRDRHRDFGAARASMLIRASGHVGGDLVGAFRLDDSRAAVYSVDVSGHGVASAMMTARLAAYLSGSVEQNLAFRQMPGGARTVRGPAELAGAFNRLMLDEIQVEQYFTMAYAEIELDSGRVRLAQAGHPHPMVIRADGGIERVGAGGLPIGLIPEAGFDEVEFSLAPGDRLFLVSDGITECPGRAGADLGEAGLADLILRLAALESGEFLEALVWCLTDFAGTGAFPDDVSALMLDYLGPKGGPG
ncbi:PP2C family protein-serine/threonine phosphatase [Pseudogemmobacter sonorensis]|uniref:PP2C family protein-serine/threonine phosphatase n=1 Tax=Pseudogemmobacter sonorensis TaxID=2989681 RepID=UPI0036CAABF4